MMFRALTAMMGLVFALVTPASSEPPPIETYGELPSIRSMAISPDGSKLAYLQSDGDTEYLVVFNQETRERQAVDTTAIKTRDVLFASETHVILRASDTTRIRGFLGRHEFSAAFAFDLETTKIKQLMAREETLYPGQTGIGRIVGYSADSTYAYMPAFVGERSTRAPSYSLMRTDLTNGRARRLVKGSADTIDYIMSRDGRVLASEDFDNEDDRYTIKTRQDGKLVDAYEETDTERIPISLIGKLPDETGLVLVDTAPDGVSDAVYTMTLAGEMKGPLFLRDGQEITAVFSDLNRVVSGVEYSGLKPSYAFFDETLDARVAALLERYSTLSFHLVSWTEDWSTVLFRVEGGSEGVAYLAFTPADGAISRLVKARDLAPEQIARVETIEYTARDGLNIPALLTVPPGVDMPDTLPLIAMPHGGPESHDQLGFDWMAQFFASRGYLVFQPNFRGSSGFGADFSRAGYGEWGGKMQDDVTDGVKGLIDSGWADPERVCIIGASYGGYSALAGGAFTPELYQCVAAIAPVSDLPRMLVDERRDYGRDHWVYAYWSEVIGDLSKGKDKLRSISPAFHAEAFQAPVLLIHGRDDTVVPMHQSTRMRNALREAGKEVELIRLRGEDHWLSSSETRLATLEALESFVLETIGPGG